MEAVAPRSTCNHCGSPKALDQRVEVLPSTAAAAAVPLFSVDDAVAGLPWDSSSSAAAWAETVPPNSAAAAMTKAIERSAAGRRERARRGGRAPGRGMRGTLMSYLCGRVPAGMASPAREQEERTAPEQAAP